MTAQIKIVAECHKNGILAFRAERAFPNNPQGNAESIIFMESLYSINIKSLNEINHKFKIDISHE